MKHLALILSGLLAGLLLAVAVPAYAIGDDTILLGRIARTLEKIAEAAERSARAHETMARERCK